MASKKRRKLVKKDAPKPAATGDAAAAKPTAAAAGILKALSGGKTPPIGSKLPPDAKGPKATKSTAGTSNASAPRRRTGFK